MSRGKRKKETVAVARERAMDCAQRLARYSESFIKDGERVCRCISCGAVVALKESEGGHLISRKVPITCLEPDNIHVQCHRCNGFLKGNYLNYRYNLVKIIGKRKVERLEHLAQASKGDPYAISRLSEEDKKLLDEKRDIEYYRMIKSILKQKCDEIEASWNK